MGTKDFREAISVFDSVFNLICDVQEGHQPLSIDFSIVSKVKSHLLLPFVVCDFL